jgi:molecular chaperone GrpE
VTEEQPRIEDEPIVDFIREDDDDVATEVIEGEVIESQADLAEEDLESVDAADAEEELDELELLRQDLESAQAQADEYLDDLRRERAAFQNFKKRQENERVEQRQMIVSSFVVDILPIVDDFERALGAVPEEQADQPWIEGMQLIQRKLRSTLESSGVVPVAAEPGQSFDPFLHEAVSYEENEDYGEGEIIAVVQNGYQLGTRTLRPAIVRVAK